MAHSPGVAFVPRLCLLAFCSLLITACALQQTVLTSPQSLSNATTESATTVITVWHTVTPSQAETLKEMVNRWAIAHEASIVVELRGMSGAESLHQAIMSAIQTQQTPDLAFVRVSDLPLYVEADATVPLNAFRASLGDDNAGGALATVDAAANCETGDESRLWAYPLHRYQTVLLVNRTQLTERLEIADPPSTWDELVSACDAHVSKNRYACLSMLPTADMATLLFYSHNNPVIAFDTGEVTMNEPSSLTLLERLAALRQRNAIQLSLSYDGAQLDFTAGRTLFAIERSDRLKVYNERISDRFDWEVIPMPGSGTEPVNLVSGGSVALFHSTREREELSLSLLAYLAEPENNREWAAAIDALPVRQSAVDLLVKEAEYPHIQQAAALLPDARGLSCYAAWGDIQPRLVQLITDTLNGAAPPESLLAGAAQATTNLAR